MQIDPLKTTYVVIGDEQLVDVEVDRRTDVKPPVKTRFIALDSKRLWNDPSRIPIESEDLEEADNQKDSKGTSITG